MHDIQLENMTIAWMKEIICEKREMEGDYKSKVQEFGAKTNDIVMVIPGEIQAPVS